MVVDLNANEVVRKAADAQHFDSENTINGKLILTNQRIFFKPVTENSNDDQLSIMPTDIREVLYFKTGLFSANGLNIVTKEGRQLKFSVKKRDSWSALINKMY